MIKELSNNLIAVCVENDTKHFYISGKYLCWNQGTVSCICRELPKGNYIILGEIVGGIINFDTKELIPNITDNLTIQGDAYPDYMNDDNMYECSSSSFYSLLQSKGCILNSDNKYIILKKD